MDTVHLSVHTVQHKVDTVQNCVYTVHYSLHTEQYSVRSLHNVQYGYLQDVAQYNKIWKYKNVNSIIKVSNPDSKLNLTTSIQFGSPNRISLLCLD